MTPIMPSPAIDSGMDEKKAIPVLGPEFGRVSPAPTSASESVSIREEADAVDNAAQPPEEAVSGLPFSKARCIALVATVTGASFLNVRK